MPFCFSVAYEGENKEGKNPLKLNFFLDHFNRVEQKRAEIS